MLVLFADGPKKIEGGDRFLYFKVIEKVGRCVFYIDHLGDFKN